MRTIILFSSNVSNTLGNFFARLAVLIIELDTDHHAESAYFADVRFAFCKILQALNHFSTEFRCTCGFGVFSVRARKTGIRGNPRTGTEVSIKPGTASSIGYAEPLPLERAVRLALTHSTTSAIADADVQRALASYRELHSA